MRWHWNTRYIGKLSRKGLLPDEVKSPERFRSFGLSIGRAFIGVMVRLPRHEGDAG